MSRPAWENPGVFFQSDRKGGFAKAAFFYLADGTRLNEESDPIYVIFDSGKLDALAGEFMLEEPDPRITLEHTARLGSLTRDCWVVIQDEGTFDLTEGARDDGTGTCNIRLETHQP